MSDKNILKELTVKIDALESTINDLRGTIGREKSDMEEIENQINNLKAKFEIKKLEVYQLNSKLEEKTRIANEARRALTKIVENTTKLIEAVDLEANEEFRK
jgi:chromosome segregation ATPase